MSVDYGNLCTEILKYYFGDIVHKVGKCLFSAKSRTFNNIVKASNLTKKEVCTALTMMINFDLVSFEPARNFYVAEYSLKHEEVHYILRYARYSYLMQKKFGEPGVSVLEAILQNGIATASSIIVQCMNFPEPGKLEDYRDTFVKMVQEGYLMRCPQVVPNEDDDGLEIPIFKIDPHLYYIVPELDLMFLNKVVNDEEDLQNAKDKGICWKINYKRFHQDFRDHLMLASIEHKMGASASECFSYILQLMYLRTEPWEKERSNPVTLSELKQTLERKSLNIELIKYFDQYVSIIADDSIGFLKRVGDAGSGQYAVQFNTAFEQLAYACIENVILERYGAKASRIFRVIRLKKFIDQDDLQKEAMVPSKEAKLLTYTLFQDQFIQVRPIRKAGGGGSGPAKAFFLYHIKPRQVVQMLLNTTYKALFNDFIRTNHEQTENKLILDKSDKLNSIVASLKDRGDSEEYISDIVDAMTPPERKILATAQNRLKKLSRAMFTLDDTSFLLEMFMYHSS